MNDQKLPNATISLVLGIVSFIACCFSMGVGGLLFSGVALFLANKDIKQYTQNPDLYDNYSQVNAAKIISIIGLLLALATMALMAYKIYEAGGWEAFQQQQMEAWEKLFGEKK